MGARLSYAAGGVVYNKTMTSYRYPNEEIILMLTLGGLFGVLLLTAGLTVCLVPLLVGVMVVLAYYMNRSHHQSLLQQATLVGMENAPQLTRLVEGCRRRLRTGPVQTFVAPQRALNAYTFGFSSPQVVVLFQPLLRVMDADELRFIVGHELGHVGLGHAWLNTLLGGMAGVPLPFGAAVVVTLAFRWWNRACEFSADRAGLLACGKPEKAISALVKLVTGGVSSQAEMDRALQVIEAEDDSPLHVLTESLSTHPMLVKRIDQIRKYAADPQYRRLLAQIEAQNQGA